MTSELAYPLIHIGYHKTGTTWFQGDFYPFLQSHNYIPHRPVRKALLFSHAFSFDPLATREWLGLDTNSPFVLCEEELSGSFQSAGHMGALSKELGERLHQVAPEAQIVIFIRNQIDMLASVYAQYVKRGGTRPPRQLFFPTKYRKPPQRQPFKVPLFSFDHFSYTGLIRHYKNIFGAEKVNVFLYEEFQKDTEHFLKEFSRKFGITYQANYINTTPINTSFRHRTLKLARVMNHFMEGKVVDKNHLLPLPSKPLTRIPQWFNQTRFAGARPTPELVLGSDMVYYIQQRYAESNQELAQETGLPLAYFGYPGVGATELA